MKRLLPVIFFVVIIAAFFKPLLINRLLPIPSDTIVGLYNPYRDLYAPQYPRGIPFKNFLITDPVRQQIPWRYLVIDAEKKFSLPLWNPYALSGTPLFANFQSAALYPLNILFFIFPFALAWSLLVLLQPFLGGLFMYWYLKNLRLHWAAALLGCLAFAFCGFAVVWMEWNTLFQTLLWVPLILLAKDKLLTKWNKSWAVIFLFAEIAAFFAGHLQTLFYALIITNAYLFLKVYLKAKKQKGQILASYIKLYLPFLIVGVLMYLITTIQWIPTLQFILQSARDVDQSPFQNPGWFIPWQHIVQLIIPDFFGNPTTLNYWGVWNYAEFASYVGIIPLIFAFAAMLFRRDKKTYFWTGLFVLSLLFALPTPLAKLPFILDIPFISTAQPTRLIAIMDISLAVLAALGLDFAIKKRSVLIIPSAIIGLVIAGSWIFAVFAYRFFHSVTLQQAMVTKHNLYFPTTIFAVTIIVLLGWILVEKITKKQFTALFGVILLIVTGFDLLRFEQKFLPFTPQMYLFPQTQTLDFLQQHAGVYRIMETDSRILPPNFSVMYRLQSVDGYDPLYLKRYGAFIAAVSRNKPDISSPFGFNRIITPQRLDSPLINLLGVKYVLSLTDVQNPQFNKVFQEGETRVYENTHVLPRAFFVKNVLPVVSDHQAIVHMFGTSFNPATDAVAEGTVGNADFSKGKITILSYSENKVILQTSSAGNGFLVLTDSFYPIWHAFIDGHETKIFVTDFTFRGIEVPSGKHTITFTDSLF